MKMCSFMHENAGKKRGINVSMSLVRIRKGRDVEYRITNIELRILKLKINFDIHNSLFEIRYS
jgi:hypothetical protein